MYIVCLYLLEVYVMLACWIIKLYIHQMTYRWFDSSSQRIFVFCVFVSGLLVRTVVILFLLAFILCQLYMFGGKLGKMQAQYSVALGTFIGIKSMLDYILLLSNRKQSKRCEQLIKFHCSFDLFIWSVLAKHLHFFLFDFMALFSFYTYT